MVGAFGRVSHSHCIGRCCKFAAETPAPLPLLLQDQQLIQQGKCWHCFDNSCVVIACFDNSCVVIASFDIACVVIACFDIACVVIACFDNLFIIIHA